MCSVLVELCVYVRVFVCMRESFLLLFEPHEFRLPQRHIFDNCYRGAHAEVKYELAIIFQ